MTGFRSQTTTGHAGDGPGAGPLAPIGRWLPLATVAFVLVLGAALRHDPASGPAAGGDLAGSRVASAGASPSDAGREDTAPAEAVAPGERPGPGAGPGGEWTLQLGLFCDPGAIHELQEAAHPGAFLLEARHEGRTCRRLCWGRFSSADAARRAEPPAELAGGASPLPRRLPEIGG